MLYDVPQRIITTVERCASRCCHLRGVRRPPLHHLGGGAGTCGALSRALVVCMQVGTSADLKVGQSCLAIGNPFGAPPVRVARSGGSTFCAQSALYLCVVSIASTAGASCWTFCGYCNGGQSRMHLTGKMGSSARAWFISCDAPLSCESANSRWMPCGLLCRAGQYTHRRCVLGRLFVGHSARRA